MPTIAERWLYAIPIALVAFHASKFRWWLGLFPLIWTAMIIKGGTSLYFHDSSGESEMYENSNVYFSSLTGSAVLMLFAICYGIYVGQERVRQTSSPEADQFQESIKS